MKQISQENFQRKLALAILKDSDISEGERKIIRSAKKHLGAEMKFQTLKHYYLFPIKDLLQEGNAFEFQYKKIEAEQRMVLELMVKTICIEYTLARYRYGHIRNNDNYLEQLLRTAESLAAYDPESGEGNASKKINGILLLSKAYKNPPITNKRLLSSLLGGMAGVVLNLCSLYPNINDARVEYKKDRNHLLKREEIVLKKYVIRLGKFLRQELRVDAVNKVTADLLRPFSVIQERQATGRKNLKQRIFTTNDVAEIKRKGTR